MSKKFIVFTLILISTLGSLSAKSWLDDSIVVGQVLPFNEGVTFDYGDSDYVRVFIHNNRLVAVFLDSQRKVKIPEGICLERYFQNSWLKTTNPCHTG